MIRFASHGSAHRSQSDASVITIVGMLPDSESSSPSSVSSKSKEPCQVSDHTDCLNRRAGRRRVFGTKRLVGMPQIGIVLTSLGCRSHDRSGAIEEIPPRARVAELANAQA